jgi:hypothetical protein
VCCATTKNHLSVHPREVVAGMRERGVLRDDEEPSVAAPTDGGGGGEEHDSDDAEASEVSDDMTASA